MLGAEVDSLRAKLASSCPDEQVSMMSSQLESAAWKAAQAEGQMRAMQIRMHTAEAQVRLGVICQCLKSPAEDDEPVH